MPRAVRPNVLSATAALGAYEMSGHWQGAMELLRRLGRWDRVGVPTFQGERWGSYMFLPQMTLLECVPRCSKQEYDVDQLKWQTIMALRKQITNEYPFLLPRKCHEAILTLIPTQPLTTRSSRSDRVLVG